MSNTDYRLTLAVVPDGPTGKKSLLLLRLEAVMKFHLWCVALLGFGLGGTVVESQPGEDRRSMLDWLPLVSDLPDNFRPIGTLGGQGEFFTAGTASRHRVDDGDEHHGLPATVAWAANRKDQQAQAQGVHYRVADGRITGAGYIVRQSDLVAGRSFYGLTLRQLDLPPAQSLTIELLEGETEGSKSYLLLWDFLPAPDQDRAMLEMGELQVVTGLPPTFTVVRNESYPNDFYPRMGRHRRVMSATRNRLPTATGAESVWYGEAAGKLIFIEYIVSQQDVADGASWVNLPLNGVPIPPIDNVHILHYNGAQPDAPGLYTVHMYFVPDEQYLSWKTEPLVLEGRSRHD